MAMWAPTLWTRAPTVLKAEVEQVRLPHTSNVRRSPSTGGMTWSAGPRPRRGAAAGGAPYRRLAAACLRNRSNARAVDRCPGGAVTVTVAAAASGAVGRNETACSRNREDVPGVPLADCGTSRYSAESTADPLAAIVTHPASDAGSIEVYAPTARTSRDAGAELHAAVPGPAASPLQANVAASDHITSRTALRRF